ncbi:hypothetical protein W97_04580 [Coniosporium apollinis CBS 100218]|uniref:EthD domain-containing protein n=1 Tax=Coniosporium apollinis (strain CBS 100218) TaxID=1168221 RepID=R7YTU2_CONA1|nr:uncharacterized protein W97_04580 [Coniosporium apollinis CBS 100218]EON65342.1 hypothetical protein W97_04580 [Coniosporium apollinis CBS 100218]
MESQQLLALTICGYKKSDISEEDYRHYMTKVHAPLVAGLMEKYGFVSWNMTHNTSATRPEMAKLYDPQFANVADYDAIVQIVFKDVDDFVRMKADPHFMKSVTPDHEKFADTKRSKYVTHLREE